ncbi:MAG: ATP-binding cassette domain-containing protein [Bacilli bacterium]|nr:ATP-binding cassette domain-containing protein [Bacilli bacterium]
MNEFIEYATEGIKYSFNKALEGKKAAVEYLQELGQFFSQKDIDKTAANEIISKAKAVIAPSTDKLKVTPDTVALIFPESLKGFVKKYFAAFKDNEKDLARFNRQSAKRDALIAKGKKIDWKVVPYKNIDTEDIRNDILSLIKRLLANYQEFILQAEKTDFHALCIELIDAFKQQASDVVYKLSKGEAKEIALKLMEEVGIPEPRLRFKQYPFEFSGGMRQRIVIAIALSANPEILICDEPTTALDVTIQSQILELINKIKAERQLSIIFITHDLGVVANMADEIAVMYAGKIVEYGTSEDIFYDPRHPYTWALLSSMPDLDTKEKLEAIPGTPPNMIYPPKGDAFAARNKYAMQIDFEEQPPMFKISDTHYAATWLLHPSAPKVEIPKIIKERIERMQAKEANSNGK